MRKPTIALMTGLVILVGGSGLTIFQRDHNARHGARKNADSTIAEEDPSAFRNIEQPSSQTVNVAALWGEVISLRHDLEALKAERSHLTPSNKTDQQEAETPPSTQDKRQDERNDVKGRKVKALLAKAEEQFANEPSDATWSSARKAGFRELSDKNDGIKNALRSVECRSHTCRVELLDDAAANLSENLPLFFSEFAATMPNVMADRVTSPDGTASYVLYLSGT